MNGRDAAGPRGEHLGVTVNAITLSGILAHVAARPRNDRGMTERPVHRSNNPDKAHKPDFWAARTYIRNPPPDSP